MVIIGAELFFSGFPSAEEAASPEGPELLAEEEDGSSARRSFGTEKKYP